MEADNLEEFDTAKSVAGPLNCLDQLELSNTIFTDEILTMMGIGITIVGVVNRQDRRMMTSLNKRFNDLKSATSKQFTDMTLGFKTVESQLGDVQDDTKAVRDRIDRVEGWIDALLQVITKRDAT